MNYVLLVTILAAFSSSMSAMDGAVTSTKKIIGHVKEAVTSVESFLDKLAPDGRVNIDNLIQDEEIADIIKLVTSHPRLFGRAQEAFVVTQTGMQKTYQQLYEKILQIIASKPNYQLHVFKARSETALACLTLFCFFYSIAVSHDQFLPGVNLANLIGILAGCAALYVHFELQPPATFGDQCSLKIYHIVYHIIQRKLAALGITHAAQKPSRELAQQYSHFYSTLTPEQKRLVADKYTFLIAQFRPDCLKDEVAFLDSLDALQVDLFADYAQQITPHIFDHSIEQLVQNLPDGTKQTLNPHNKFRLLAINPLIALQESNSAFVRLLSQEQLDNFIQIVANPS